MMQEVLFFLIAILSIIDGNINVALGKDVSASSQKVNNAPEKAVDGDRTALEFSVYHSNDGVSSSWWCVDLGQEVTFPRVSIYFRTDYTWRRNGVRISLSSLEGAVNEFCQVVTGAADGSDIPDIYNFTCDARGRYMNISTVTDNDGCSAILDFGEVEVYVRNADEVSIFTKYIPLCDVSVAFNFEYVDMAQILELEQFGLDSRIECMWKCEALDLCIFFEYQSPTCTFWRKSSSGLSGSKEMWKRQY